MTVSLRAAAPAEASVMFAQIAPWVSEAIEDFGTCWTLPDVRARLADGTLQLWLIKDGARSIGIICTEVYDTARGKTCALPIVYCEDMAASIAGVLTDIEAWARSIGCVRLQGEGRRGWERALRPLGWKTITTQVEKVL